MRALIVIDMQMDMQARLDAGRDCVNPGAGPRIAALLARFRAAGAPAIHVRHHDSDPASPMHPSAPGAAPMPCAAALPGEPVFVKSTSSAFASTGLEAHLRAAGIEEIVLCGAVAGFCVNSTARAGSDLGFRVVIARDAALGFDLPGMSARLLFDATMALLAADFAAVVDSETLIP